MQGILAEAAAETGLDDFGDEWFLAPLEPWAADLDQPGLSDFGRRFLRRIALRDVCRRLRVIDTLSANPYRRPFLQPGEARRPTLTWPREIPFDGEPSDVHAMVADNSRWLGSTMIPKLLINVFGGDTPKGELLEIARRWPNQTEIDVTGRHFEQEDGPTRSAMASPPSCNPLARPPNNNEQ